MNGTSRGGLGRLAMLWVWTLPLPAAPAAEVLVEGFEGLGGLKPAGKVVAVTGADAVTQGQNAVQLSPEASVTLRLPARALGQVGWLKIDTFGPRPVLGCLEIDLAGTRWRGYVQPGRDTLAVPLSLAASGHRGPWPPRATEVRLANAGPGPVVLDNARLAEPAPAPQDVVLLDFGPANQVIWPGFEPGGLQATGMAWSGEAKIYGYSAGHPDRLLGDFAGRRPGYKTLETVTIRRRQPGRVWLWVTHFGHMFSASVEYAVRLNGQTLTRRRRTPRQMLSPEGLLIGKDQPWTGSWLEDHYLPAIVSHLQRPLKRGDNHLELANSQLAAMILAPQAQEKQTAQYVRLLEADLKRYRRQFVLAGRHEGRCTVLPTELEAERGCMIFLPPRDEWFHRAYTPAVEHRTHGLKMTLANGSTALAALAAVPIRAGRSLQVSADLLRGPRGRTFRAEIAALEDLSVVDEGVVYAQPYLPARSVGPARVRQTHWLCVTISPPQRAPAGTYRGRLHLTFDRAKTSLPLEVDLVQLPPDPKREKWTFGVLSAGHCYDAYRSLSDALPVPQQDQLSRKILSRLASEGINATLLKGPYLHMTGYRPRIYEMGRYLKSGLRLRGTGRDLIGMTSALGAMGRLAPGTTRHQNVLAELVRETRQLAEKNGVKDYAFLCGLLSSPSDFPDMLKRLEAMRRVDEALAVTAEGHVLAAADGPTLARLFGLLEVLVVGPAKGMLATGRAFKKTGARKTLALRIDHPDTYALGFYCWAVAADGAYIVRVFSSTPVFDGFWFDGRSLLAPTAAGDFEPTLTAACLRQGLADYDLTRRCEALLAAADGKADAADLARLLDEIRTTADANPPDFSTQRLRSLTVAPQTLQKWRDGLIREGSRLAAKLEAAGP